jgi:hypothetical protein
MPRRDTALSRSGSVRTHVNFVFQSVIYDLEQSDDVSVAALLHYGDFLSNFGFCGAKLVTDR